MDQQRTSKLIFKDRMMLAAISTAHSSTCSRRAVGCVLTNASGKVVATGYNGAPSGQRHCIEKGCILHDGHCIQCVHAELNACLQCYGSARMAFCTDKPCLTCLRALMNKGVSRIFYWRNYDDPMRDSFIVQNGLDDWDALIPLAEPIYQEVWDAIVRRY